jgi:putative transposase
MTAYIEDDGARFGVEPICRALEWNPSTFYAARKRPPSRRALKDASLIPHIRRVHRENYGAYGVRKLHKALRREGFEVARCSVARLMRQESLQGMRRGRKKRTTIPDER